MEDVTCPTLIWYNEQLMPRSNKNISIADIYVGEVVPVGLEQVELR